MQRGAGGSPIIGAVTWTGVAVAESFAISDGSDTSIKILAGVVRWW